MKCQVNGCKETAKFALYKTFPNGSKRWLNVCKQHDEEIGQENIQHAGGYIRKSKSGELVDDEGAIK